jgi:hypothetical protein
MNHYVYRTKRGLLRTVQADTPVMAWNLARKKHSPAYLFNLSGDAWVESSWPGCVRERDADATPEDARAMYLDACAAELPAAVEELPRLARAAADVAPGLLRLCAARGLVLLFPVVPQPRLTDLGRAFVARTGGAS